MEYNTELNHYEINYENQFLHNYRDAYIDNTNEWRFILKDLSNYGKVFKIYRDSNHTIPLVAGISSEGIIGVPGSGTNGTDPYVAINLSKALEGIDTNIENIQALTGFTHETSSEVSITYGGSKLFDNNNSTYWATAHNAGYHNMAS